MFTGYKVCAWNLCTVLWGKVALMIKALQSKTQSWSVCWWRLPEDSLRLGLAGIEVFLSIYLATASKAVASGSILWVVEYPDADKMILLNHGIMQFISLWSVRQKQSCWSLRLAPQSVRMYIPWHPLTMISTVLTWLHPWHPWPLLVLNHHHMTSSVASLTSVSRCYTVSFTSYRRPQADN